MVTAGTSRKAPHLHNPDRLEYFQERLFAVADEFSWTLQAWAIFANHYHFIATSPEDAGTMNKFLGKLHMTTAKQLNLWDEQPGRRVWFQFWDSHIPFEKSYLARLNYVHHNPVKHGVAEDAETYRWCSAAWFAQHASPALVNTVHSFKIDQIKVPDDF
jgi:putative transposase